MSREHGFESQSDAGGVQVTLDKEGRPDHVLVVCDFKCSIDVCSRKFKAIKSIALDFGYDPISFSLKFFKTFNVWPSEVRKTAGSWSDVLENHFISLREREHTRSKIILCDFS